MNINTDSPSSLRALWKANNGNVYADKVKEHYAAACESNSVNLHYIRDHVGHAGNEEVVKAAREATLLDNETNVPYPQIVFESMSQERGPEPVAKAFE